MSEIKAIIRDASVQVSYKYDGRDVEKNITIESFIKTLQSGLDNVKTFHFFPPGMRLQATKGNNVIVAYEFPERVQEIIYRVSQGTNETFKTLFPWGITFIEFSILPDGYQWKTFYQLAIKGPIVLQETMMYEWPGTNIYNDHSICMGSNNPPKVAHLSQTSGFPFLFYNGVNTHNISGGKFNIFSDEKGSRIDDPYKLYKYLEPDKDGKTKPYPYDKLKSAITLKSFLELRGYI